jgi:hypothetical protein
MHQQEALFPLSLGQSELCDWNSQKHKKRNDYTALTTAKVAFLASLRNARRRIGSTLIEISRFVDLYISGATDRQMNKHSEFPGFCALSIVVDGQSPKRR